MAIVFLTRLQTGSPVLPPPSNPHPQSLCLLHEGQRTALTLKEPLLAPQILTPSPFSPEVDVEGMEFGPGELDSVGSSSDVDDHYSLQSGGCSDGGYGPPCRRPGRPGLS